MKRCLPSILCRSLTLGVLFAFLPTVLSASDPFYDRLLEDGTRALERNDYASAIHSLRLACFGLLDEVDRLASCLSYLAVAQAESGDDEAFLKTFDRILETERRFQALSRLDLNPKVRAILDVHLFQKVPYQTLKDLPHFANVARQQLEEKVVGLPIDERRQQLENLLLLEPDSLSWRILMAEVDLESKNYAAAAAGADRVLSRDVELLKAICIRGQSRAALDNCPGALIDLYTCDEDHSMEFLNRLKAQCHLKLGQFEEATTMAQLLPQRERRVMTREIAAQRQQARRPPPPLPQPETFTEDSQGGAPPPPQRRFSP
jgi:tetratricopeptide (TPR) repeat protein